MKVKMMLDVITYHESKMIEAWLSGDEYEYNYRKELKENASEILGQLVRK